MTTDVYGPQVCPACGHELTAGTTGFLHESGDESFCAVFENVPVLFCEHCGRDESDHEAQQRVAHWFMEERPPAKRVIQAHVYDWADAPPHAAFHQPSGQYCAGEDDGA